MWLGCGWRHARKRWAREFGDFEKELDEILTLVRAVQLGATGCAFVGSVSWDPIRGRASPAGG